jgi:hypothetical protein
MKKFFVLYLAPVSVIEAWTKTDPETRKPAEDKMRSRLADLDERAWGDAHGHARGTWQDQNGFTAQGISDARNDNMLYCVVQAESHEAAAKLFANHPHLGIPQASIEIMELNPLSGMK